MIARYSTMAGRMLANTFIPKMLKESARERGRRNPYEYGLSAGLKLPESIWCAKPM